MTLRPRHRRWPLIALATVAGVTAACGGSAEEAADGGAPVPVGDAPAGVPDEPWDEADGPGVVALRPVVECGDDASPRASKGEELLTSAGGEDPCVVGPKAGSGQVFERDSAVVVFDEVEEIWAVDVGLRAAGRVVVEALVEQCLAGDDVCESSRVAVVLDDVIQTALPAETIAPAGTMRITGGLSEERARMLARALDRGAEPVAADDREAASADDSTARVAPRSDATTSVPETTDVPTTEPASPTEDASGFVMPAMCGLPSVEWTDSEHPDSRGEGAWATGSRDEGDLDGDDRDEVVWATMCGVGTVAAERAVHVFDPDRRLIATLPVEAAVADTYPDRMVHALEPRVIDGEVRVAVWVWQSADETCCPSVSFPMSFAWTGAGFEPTSTVPDPATTAAPAGETPVVDWDGEYRPKTSPGRVVRLGEYGRQVELLQQALDQRGYDVDVDGYFGRGTEGAVRQFQRDRGLPVTGVATDDVWDAFGE